MRAGSSLLAILLSGSAMGSQPAEPASAVVARSAGAAPQVRADPDLSPTKAGEMGALLAAAAQVLASPEFAANLGEAAAGLDLRMAPNGAQVAPADLSRMLRGDHPGVRYAPAVARWRFFGGSNTIVEGGRPVIQLKRGIRSLWRSSDARRRACAVNSAAHEVSHTLTAQLDGFEWLIADWDYQNTPQSQHFASYTIGSVAQCTWLDRQGGLTGTVRECVLRNGTRDYTPDC